MKRIAALLIAIGLAVLAKGVVDFISFRNLSNADRFNILWSEDIAKMENQNLLPAGWNEIASLEITGDAECKAWIKDKKIPISISPTGKFSLELLVVPWSQDGKAGALIQYDLIKLENQNTVWDKTRTIIFSDETSIVEQFIKAVQKLVT